MSVCGTSVLVLLCNICSGLYLSVTLFSKYKKMPKQKKKTDEIMKYSDDPFGLVD